MAQRERALADQRRWHRDWRFDRRYDWRGHRDRYGYRFRAPRYFDPFGYSHGYRRFLPGVRLGADFYHRRYWILDPYRYRLPDAWGPYRWIRYYDDALLVDGYGRVHDGRYGHDWRRHGRDWGRDRHGIPVYVGDGDFFPDDRDYRWAERMERDEDGELAYDRDYPYDLPYGAEVADEGAYGYATGCEAGCDGGTARPNVRWLITG